MKHIRLLTVALAATALVAFHDRSDASAAQEEVVAVAGPQQLSVTRLGELLGNAAQQIPTSKEVALLVARDLWMPYHLLALAAARGDSLNDGRSIDSAAAAMLQNALLGPYLQAAVAKLPVDSGNEASYRAAKGDLYSARHILLMVPTEATPKEKAAIRKKMEGIRAKATATTFADLAKKNSQDGSAKDGGSLGVFPRTRMVKPFGDALAKLKPGEISPIVETQFGYHIIQRNNWATAKADYMSMNAEQGKQQAESTFIAQTEAAANIKIADNAAATMKLIAKDPLAARRSTTPIATVSGATMTAANVALVLLAAPTNQRLMQQIQASPDSIVLQYLKSIAQREALVRRAEAEKVTTGPSDLAALHRDFAQAVSANWATLGVDPKMLADSGKTVADRERLAARQVDAFLDKVLAGTTQPVNIPAPVLIVLVNKYPSSVNEAAVDRVVERATKLRVAVDSARNAALPKSVVPLPGKP
ncbi:MAG: peptidylprolyl isomerase [Gemmatimonadota bacterium]